MQNIEAFAGRREWAKPVAACAALLWLGGCSMSIPGFVDPTPTASIKSKTYPFAEEDWRNAEPALAAAIRADAGAEPAAWSNADSGRKGQVEGVGARYQRAGANCRMFVAHINGSGDARAVQGKACLKGGEVTVSDAAPFKSL